MKHRASYSSLQIALHWLVALLVAVAWFTGDGVGRLLRQKIEGGDPGTPLHVWIGIAVAATVAVRILTRLTTGTPGPIDGASETEAKLRHWGHVLLYVLLIGVPLGGLTTWYGGVGGLGDVHALGGNALFFLAGAHALISLWHHYFRKDGTLRRMISSSAT